MRSFSLVPWDNIFLTEGMVRMDKAITPAKSYNPQKIRTRTTIGAVMAGIVSLAFVAGTFWYGLKLFPYTSILPSTFGLNENTKEVNWSILDGIAGLATVSLVMGGIVFALIDYVQNAVQRKREDAETSFNIYKEIYDRLMNPEALAARRWVILNLPTIDELQNDKKAWLERVHLQVNKVPRGWKGDRPPGKEYIKEILNTFDFIGFVAKHYWNMENELVMWMSPSIAKVWERLELYVEEEARLREEPDYYESAREFGKYCVEWRRKHYPKSKIIKNAT